MAMANSSGLTLKYFAMKVAMATAKFYQGTWQHTQTAHNPNPLASFPLLSGSARGMRRRMRRRGTGGTRPPWHATTAAVFAQLALCRVGGAQLGSSVEFSRTLGSRYRECRAKRLYVCTDPLDLENKPRLLGVDADEHNRKPTDEQNREKNIKARFSGSKNNT